MTRHELAKPGKLDTGGMSLSGDCLQIQSEIIPVWRLRPRNSTLS